MAKGTLIADDIISGLESVTRTWAKQRKAEERHASARANRQMRMMRWSRTTQREVVFEKWKKRTSRRARTARCPPIAGRSTMPSGRKSKRWPTKSSSTTPISKPCSPNNVNEHDPNWDIVYDDRGHFIEPHTARSIGLGTLNVRSYLSRLHDANFADAALEPASIETYGPDGCYRGILFIEKEGFMPLFNAVNLAERYDIGIMSTKGLWSHEASASKLNRSSVWRVQHPVLSPA